jgi:hypothetical protein
MTVVVCGMARRIVGDIGDTMRVCWSDGPQSCLAEKVRKAGANAGPVDGSLGPAIRDEISAILPAWQRKRHWALTAPQRARALEWLSARGNDAAKGHCYRPSAWRFE